MWHKRLIAAPAVLEKLCSVIQNEFCIELRAGAGKEVGRACDVRNQSKRPSVLADPAILTFILGIVSTSLLTGTTIDRDSVSSLVWMTPKQASARLLRIGNPPAS
jgi:hypothetical protein